MEPRLTVQDIWTSTLIFGLAGVILLLPLLFIFRTASFHRSAWQMTIASGVFWGAMATLAVILFWDLYYQYFFPGWARKWAPFDALLYAAIGLGLWWLACRMPGPAVLWFILLGGIEAIAEHLLGIYAFHILDKVPMLQGLPAVPLLVFSFWEYILYWSVVAWLGFGILKLWQLLAHTAGAG